MSNNISIGNWGLNLETGEINHLYDSSKKKNLTSKPLLFVNVLAEGKGEAVPKKKIIDYVWAGYTSPENITQVINKLRVIFEDNEKSIFVNHPSIGYSLVFQEYPHAPHSHKNSDLPIKEKVESETTTNETKFTPCSCRTGLISSFVKYSGITALCTALLFVAFMEYHQRNIKNAISTLSQIKDITIDDYTCALDLKNEKLFCQK